MNPKLQNSLHALAMAARKGMVPQDVENHMTAIIEEVEHIQRRANMRDEVSALTATVPAELIRNVSGRAEIGRTVRVEFKGEWAEAVNGMADGIESQIQDDLKMFTLLTLLGYHEVAAIADDMAKTRRTWADRFRACAKTNPKP